MLTRFYMQMRICECLIWALKLNGEESGGVYTEFWKSWKMIWKYFLDDFVAEYKISNEASVFKRLWVDGSVPIRIMWGCWNWGGVSWISSESPQVPWSDLSRKEPELKRHNIFHQGSNINYVLYARNKLFWLWFPVNAWFIWVRLCGLTKDIE